jgi:hypothetical protein
MDRHPGRAGATDVCEGVTLAELPVRREFGARKRGPRSGTSSRWWKEYPFDVPMLATAVLFAVVSGELIDRDTVRIGYVSCSGCIAAIAGSGRLITKNAPVL